HPRCGFGVVDEIIQFAVEARAANQLHAEVALVLVLTHLEDRYDARVVEHRDRLGLVLESPQVVFGGQHTCLQHLERHRPVQADLASSVNHAHATSAQHAYELIVAEVPDASAEVDPIAIRNCTRSVGGPGVRVVVRADPALAGRIEYFRHLSAHFDGPG